jgi:hypothetical protein
LRKRRAKNHGRHDDGRRAGASHISIIAPEPQKADEDSYQSNDEDGTGDSGSAAEPEGKQRRDSAEPDQAHAFSGLVRHATAAFLPITLASSEEVIRQRKLCLRCSRET